MCCDVVEEPVYHDVNIDAELAEQRLATEQIRQHFPRIDEICMNFARHNPRNDGFVVTSSTHCSCDWTADRTH